jgi:hypothetical protein
MWDPQHLTILQASMACYEDSFSFNNSGGGCGGGDSIIATAITSITTTANTMVNQFFYPSATLTTCLPIYCLDIMFVSDV